MKKLIIESILLIAVFFTLGVSLVTGIDREIDRQDTIALYNYNMYSNQ